MENTTGYALDWDSEIEDSGFVLLPEGDYPFRVLNMERERYEGGSKIGPCNKVILELLVESPEGNAVIKYNLLLHSVLQWKLSEFFIAIGQMKRGGKLLMNWNNVIGTSGRCSVGIRKYTTDKGEEREINEIKKFYDPGNIQQKSYKAGVF